MTSDHAGLLFLLGSHDPDHVAQGVTLLRSLSLPPDEVRALHETLVRRRVQPPIPFDVWEPAPSLTRLPLPDLEPAATPEEARQHNVGPGILEQEDRYHAARCEGVTVELPSEWTAKAGWFINGEPFVQLRSANETIADDSEEEGATYEQRWEVYLSLEDLLADRPKWRDARLQHFNLRLPSAERRNMRRQAGSDLIKKAFQQGLLPYDRDLLDTMDVGVLFADPDFRSFLVDRELTVIRNLAGLASRQPVPVQNAVWAVMGALLHPIGIEAWKVLSLPADADLAAVAATVNKTTDQRRSHD